MSDDEIEEPAAASLPRTRASLTVLFAAAALLAAGGFLEYGTGSPDAGESIAVGYWSALFAFHAFAFGGAALIGGLPVLATRPLKFCWGVLLSMLYGLTFAAWLAPQEMNLSVALVAWARKLPAQMPAAAAIVSGLLWTDLGTRRGNGPPHSDGA